ncbi:uncharacterized protein TNCV_2252871 [Trichonephila clavipes]|nr:uncharacterized protein TNCV_2252871 [Trichonephila clavipes]
MAVGSLVVGASDSRSEGLVSRPVPRNTLRVHTEYVLVKSVGPKVLWAESRVQGTGENFPPLLFHAKIVEAKDMHTCHDAFRVPRSDYVRQVALATTTTTEHSAPYIYRTSKNIQRAEMHILLIAHSMERKACLIRPHDQQETLTEPPIGL